jgi:hypothetical protein
VRPLPDPLPLAGGALAAAGPVRAPWWSLLAPPLLGAGVWTLLTDVPGWNAVWYLFVWYAWLLALDAAVWALGGRSWIAAQGRALLLCAYASVPFWYVYEAYNLRLQNWYYVFVLRDDALQLVVSFLAFATVLPACFLHAELVGALRLFARTRWRPLRVGHGLERAVLALGVASLVLPLVFPRWAFPLVWGATFWLPELWCWQRGGDSLLRDLTRGRPQRLLALLVGGMLAGLAWELFNFWARCKWIYTVPFFDRLKLFEMPLLGFLGFPLLALDAFASWNALRLLLAPRKEPTGDTAETRVARNAGLVALAVLSLLFCLETYRLVLVDTVRSRRPLLEELAGLGVDGARRLAASDLATPERLVRAVGERGVDGVALQSGVPAPRLATAAAQAALALHKAMGTRAAQMLQAAGVPDVATLGRADAPALWHRLDATLRTSGPDEPRLAEVQIWVEAARGREAPRR